MLMHHYKKALFITWRDVGAVAGTGDNNVGLICGVERFTCTKGKYTFCCKMLLV